LEKLSANFCRDAITMGRADIVKLSLDHGLDPNSKADSTIIFRGNELGMLPSVVQSVRAITDIITNNKQCIAQYFWLLDEFKKIAEMLLEAKANPDQDRFVYSEDHHASAILLGKSTRMLAEEYQLAVFEDEQLTPEERQYLEEIYEVVADAPSILQHGDELESPVKKLRGMNIDDGNARRNLF
jgi:hypothetical protein